MKSIEQQIKDLREAMNDTTMKLAGFNLIEAGVKAEDMKAIKMGLEMAALNKNIKHCIVPNCGHNIHIENLDYFIDVLTSKEKNDNYR